MTPELANAVDPIFLHVLHLLESIRSGNRHNSMDERAKIDVLLAAAETTLGNSSKWQLCKYALVSWIDELLVETHWDGREWWGNNVIEMEIFNSRACYEMFFVKAKEASALADRDAMEIFYICVMLGFRGLYEDSDIAASIIESHNLPPTLDRWTQQAALSIRSGSGRPPLVGKKHDIRGAPLRGGIQAAVWTWFGAGLLSFAGILYYLLILSARDSYP
ncbi:MAG: DotU family type IV/VI secretion system protein [Planctomycetota bacterium]|nr:DotU family type IV/VI secretion system protein [Planctomycetota bacterium]